MVTNLALCQIANHIGDNNEIGRNPTTRTQWPTLLPKVARVLYRSVFSQPTWETPQSLVSLDSQSSQKYIQVTRDSTIL